MNPLPVRSPPSGLYRIRPSHRVLGRTGMVRRARRVHRVDHGGGRRADLAVPRHLQQDASRLPLRHGDEHSQAIELIGPFAHASWSRTCATPTCQRAHAPTPECARPHPPTHPHAHASIDVHPPWVPLFFPLPFPGCAASSSLPLTGHSVPGVRSSLSVGVCVCLSTRRCGIWLASSRSGLGCGWVRGVGVVVGGFFRVKVLDEDAVQPGDQ